MSFVSHVNNTCLIPPAIKNPQASTTKTPDMLNPARLALAPSAAADAPQTAGIVTKISDGKPAESVTYTVPTQKKVSISDVAVGTLVSAVGGVVGAGLGKYTAQAVDNGQYAGRKGAILGGVMGMSCIPGNVFKVLNTPPEVTPVLSISAVGAVASAFSIIQRLLHGQNNLAPNLNLPPNVGIATPAA